MRIFNKSVSAVARSCAVAPINGESVVVWLDLAPQHPAILKAIWATLVNNTQDRLGLRDDEKTLYVTGLHSRYLRLQADAPMLASRSKIKFLRLLAPTATKIEDLSKDFFAFAWPAATPGQSLAAMLEAGTAYPIRIGWGEWLLYIAMARGFVTPLVTLGPAPDGYHVLGSTPWREIISQGVRDKALFLDGCATVIPPEQFAEAKEDALAKAYGKAAEVKADKSLAKAGVEKAAKEVESNEVETDDIEASVLETHAV